MCLHESLGLCLENYTQTDSRSRRILPARHVFLNVFSILLMILACGCSHESLRDEMYSKIEHANPRAAAYAAEGFTFDKRQVERPNTVWDFYYKHCNLISRNPYPEKEAWSCTEPY